MPASSDDFPLQIENAIVCEDVRAEVGGKHSIIGLYSGDIIVPEFENYLKIAVFIVLFARAAGDITLDATISYAGKDFIKLNAKLEYKDARDPGVLVTPSFPVELTGPGFIDVRAVCQGKEKRLLRKEVRQASLFLPARSRRPLRNLRSSVSRKRTSARRAVLLAAGALMRLSLICVVWFLAGRDTHDLNGVADHVSGTLLASGAF